MIRSAPARASSCRWAEQPELPRRSAGRLPSAWPSSWPQHDRRSRRHSAPTWPRSCWCRPPRYLNRSSRSGGAESTRACRTALHATRSPEARGGRLAWCRRLLRRGESPGAALVPCRRPLRDAARPVPLDRQAPLGERPFQGGVTTTAQLVWILAPRLPNPIEPTIARRDRVDDRPPACRCRGLLGSSGTSCLRSG